jgi:hypothetical protein
MAQLKSGTALYRRFPLATIFVVLWVALLAGLFFRFGALDEARASLAQQEAEGKRIEKNVLNGTGLDKQVAALTAGLSKLEAKLIRPDDVGTNQQYFYELVSATGVRLANLRPLGVAQGMAQGVAQAKSKAPAANYLPFGYGVVVDGSFAQVLAFVRALETGARHYRLVDYGLQRQTQDPGAGTSNGGKVVLNLNLELLASS